MNQFRYSITILRRILRNAIVPYKSGDRLKFVRRNLREEYGLELIWPPNEGHFRGKSNNIKAYVKNRKYMLGVFFDEIGHVTEKEWLCPKNQWVEIKDIM
jgi:hypothetical protein